jgi:hypothetical protein
MKYLKELSLVDFEFWSGAKQHKFTYSELKELEYSIEDLFYNESATETQINDLFWFEDEMLCEWLNLDYDEYLNR